MNDKMFYFLVGFMTMGLIAMITVAYNPKPPTDITCMSCGSEQWWFTLAEDE